MSREVTNRVTELVEPILSNGAMELVEVEFRREGRGRILRLYIDKEGGVTLDDCFRISQEVGRILDIEDFISVPYTLEVSSPGLTRPLKTEKDFMKYQNHFIRVKTFEPIEDRRNFKGRLLGLVREEIEMEVDGRVFQIPSSRIAKANLEIEF